MPFYIQHPTSFGRFTPDGDFVGRVERDRAYFYEVLTDEERQSFDNRPEVYALHVSNKFTSDSGPILDHEWPTEYRTEKPYKALGSFLRVTNRVILVDEAFKSLVEEFEPNLHDFRRIEMLHRKGDPYDRTFYTMVIRKYIDSFDPQKTDDDTYDERIVGRYIIREDYAERIALDKTRYAGCDLWSETKFLADNCILSDRFVAELKARKLAMPKLYKFREV